MARSQLSYPSQLWMAHRKLLELTADVSKLRELDQFDLQNAIEDAKRFTRRLKLEQKRRDEERYGDEAEQLAAARMRLADALGEVKP